MSFIIRDAQFSDVEFIARTVLSGVGYAAFDENAQNQPIELSGGAIPMSAAVEAFTAICAREDTLYSFARTRIACVDGRLAGALISYPGGENAELRDYTWSLLDGASHRSAPLLGDVSPRPPRSLRYLDDPGEQAAVAEPVEAPAGKFADAEPECEAGEYYLDSLAVHPDFRGMPFDYEGSTEKLGHILLLDGIRRGQALGYTRTSLIVDVDRPRLHHYYSHLGFRPDRDILFFGHHYTRMVR
jgi:ribosomal protein S18 acetylase RimI-like enzyme